MPFGLFFCLESAEKNKRRELYVEIFSEETLQVGYLTRMAQKMLKYQHRQAEMKTMGW